MAPSSTNRTRVAVLASGRGSNFKALAQSCADESFPAEIVLLVTDNLEAGAIEIAKESGIEWRTVEPGKKRGRLAPGEEERIVGMLDEAGVELVFLAGFMRILKGPLLDRFPGRILNVHPSLLPSFKGLEAQRQALEYGVKIAGCSVHFVDKSVDGGPIILQAAVPVEDGDDFDSLAKRILDQEHRIVPEAVRVVAQGNFRIEGRRVLFDQ
ncbi:MAG: phosphoribosylglycinamide formyltransferase [Candidatus Latescibacterota bacterium]